jgi:hypothetical protein
MIREDYNKIFANYWLIALLISGTAFLISLFFTTKVKSFPLDFNTFVISAAMSISIGYQYALIKNIRSKILQTFKKLSSLFQGHQYQKFSLALDRKLRRSWRFYLTIILVVTPFIILELNKVWKWKLLKQEPPYFYLSEPTLWSLLLDIFNEVFIYLILFLLAVVIWIIIELTFITKELNEKYEINADIFNVDETGGLKPLRILILSAVSNYFIVITLAIISYIPPVATIYFYIYPKVLITPEIIMLTLMLLIGIVFFVTTQKTIRNLIDKSADLELEKINEKYKEIYDKIFKIVSSKMDNYNDKELGELRTALDLLEKRELKIKEIKSKRFDTKTIITFIFTVLLPILTLIHQIKTL